MEDPDPQSTVPDIGTICCSMFIQRCGICFLKAMYAENTRVILSYFYVQLFSPLHKCLTTPRHNTIDSDPSSEALVSLSNLSGYQKPYHFLPLRCPTFIPYFPCILPLQHFQAPQVLYFSLLHTPTFLASSSILHSLLAKALASLSFLPSPLVPAALSFSCLKPLAPWLHTEVLVSGGTQLLHRVLLIFDIC